MGAGVARQCSRNRCLARAGGRKPDPEIAGQEPNPSFRTPQAATLAPDLDLPADVA
jgi:hypothetical protein